MRKAEAEVFRLGQDIAARKATIKSLSRKPMQQAEAKERLQKVEIKYRRAYQRRDRAERKMVRYL